MRIRKGYYVFCRDQIAFIVDIKRESGTGVPI